jgi:hypothetical protein
MSQTGNPSADKIKQYDDPVLFSTNGGNIWHIPVVEGDTARFLCGRDGDRTSSRVAEYSFFSRRRKARQCKACEHRAQNGGASRAEVPAND